MSGKRKKTLKKEYLKSYFNNDQKAEFDKFNKQTFRNEFRAFKKRNKGISDPLYII